MGIRAPKEPVPGGGVGIAGCPHAPGPRAAQPRCHRIRIRIVLGSRAVPLRLCPAECPARAADSLKSDATSRRRSCLRVTFTESAVRAYLQPFRTSPTAPAAHPSSPRTVAGWILTHPGALPVSERLKLKSVLVG